MDSLQARSSQADDRVEILPAAARCDRHAPSGRVHGRSASRDLDGRFDAGPQARRERHHARRGTGARHRRGARLRADVHHDRCRRLYDGPPYHRVGRVGRVPDRSRAVCALCALWVDAVPEHELILGARRRRGAARFVPVDVVVGHDAPGGVTVPVDVVAEVSELRVFGRG